MSSIAIFKVWKNKLITSFCDGCQLFFDVGFCRQVYVAIHIAGSIVFQLLSRESNNYLCQCEPSFGDPNLPTSTLTPPTPKQADFMDIKSDAYAPMPIVNGIHGSDHLEIQDLSRNPRKSTYELAEEKENSKNWVWEKSIKLMQTIDFYNITYQTYILHDQNFIRFPLPKQRR